MMKKSLQLFPIILLFIAEGCKLDSPDNVLIDNSMDIYYINSGQEDLLDTAAAGGFTSDSIHLYNVVNGAKNEVINRSDYPHNFFIFRNDFLHKYGMRVFVEVDTTLLELNNSITDTITCEFDRSENTFIIRKVWYNGNLKWDDYATNREFFILK